MARRIRIALVRLDDTPAVDIAGGVWIVLLLLGLMHLPTLVS